jgi:hypothetical protein
MRTAIFLGLTAIADAIRADWLTDPAIIKVASFLLFCMIVMDVIEFFKTVNKKS